ncbi:MAG TPA: alanine dehydrogenase [Rhizobiales bacterium]|nr:alanine dehydrogenase [Hyphomicrobiales bacterium]
MHANFKNIAIVREVESPENPGGLEKRVSVVPEDAGRLVSTGLKVYVEAGAGDGVGFSDAEYLAAGAVIQSAGEIYRDKDLIIKFKGPSLSSIDQMRPGCTLLCMAHFGSFPDRAKLLQERQINVVAMEEILESPKITSDETILARTAMAAALQPFADDNTLGGLKVRVLQWSERIAPAIRRAGNRDPKSLKVVQGDIGFGGLEAVGPQSLYFYDSRSLDNDKLIATLVESGSHLFDLAKFERQQGEKAIANWKATHPPHEFGLRRIQCLHQTGQAGARYGLQLLQENKPNLDIRKAKVVVLGYGNVGQGAIHEIYDHGVEVVSVLGRTHTSTGRIDYWLDGVDLVVNGADQPEHLRGINYLVSNEHLKTLIPDGSVVIDLVGGSPTNRSPVEPVLSCTYLTKPHFVQDGVTVSALWGWPMMGMMRETAITYSGQIVDVLTGRERLLDGLGGLAPGVKRALVCGPFDV